LNEAVGIQSEQGTVEQKDAPHLTAAARRLWKIISDLSGYRLLLATLMIAIVMLATNFQPTRIYGWLIGPAGRIYVNSPGVYTRERLLNDRNDQDFWLRGQLKALDEYRVIDYATVAREQGSFGTGAKDQQTGDPLPPNYDSGATPPAPGSPLPAPGIAPPASPTAPAQAYDPKTDPTVRPMLSFVDAYTIRAAARDKIRQSVLENLLDDRHDLTGNSVYGLKFDTTVYPGRFTAGRAFVRLSITAGQSELFREETELPGLEDKIDPFPDLPYHLRKYFESSYSDIKNNPKNANYNSFNLYTQWLANVSWRLNSYFLQIFQTKCTCDGACSLPQDWRAEIVSTVNTVLAIDNAKLPRPRELNGDQILSLEKVGLPDPWDRFLSISVNIPSDRGCNSRPEFVVNGIDDMIQILPTSKKLTLTNYKLIEELDEADSAYLHIQPSIDGTYATGETHYRNIVSIARFVKSIGKINEFCITDENQPQECLKYISIPAGYFNFIEKVIQPDMYAYSLFPRIEATSVLNTRSNSTGIDQPIGGGSQFKIQATQDEARALLDPVAVGFTDSQSTKSIDFGWVIEVRPGGVPFQKSQFALISVPAWTSRLSVTVRTGWLGSSSKENSEEPYSYSVPIPPDYEAFDAFIGGEEAVRRPQISDELMDDRIDLVACRPASILIPGLRLWRSAMVTVGSERADRITVLPNMRGIIADFTKLARPVEPGPVTLRVWTSEGVDTQKGKVYIVPPDPGADCGDKTTDVQPALPAIQTAPDANVGAPNSTTPNAPL
jgi:hypothetical protein